MLNLFFVLVSISFFQGIPKELGESARIDGAMEVKVFIYIILPVSKPLLATIAIFTAVGHWNSWFDADFFVQNKNILTLGYQLMSMLNKTIASLTQGSVEVSINSQITTMSVQVAAMLIAVVPVLVVYPFFQRYFVSGLTIGSVKA
jgi:putative aldouronate transport system permease protein